MIDIDEFTSICSQLVDEIPGPLLKDLNGGILVSDKRPMSTDTPPGAYRLGEYIVDPQLGRYIVIYYLSFAKLYSNLSRPQLCKRIREVFLHEIRHHIETRAGIYDLVEEDMQRLTKMWQQARSNRDPI